MANVSHLVAKVSEGRRRSLAETLAEYEHLDEGSEEWETFLKDMEVVEEQEIDARGFRHHAKSTQTRQDLVLRLYRKFVKECMLKRLKLDEPDDIDNAAFPPKDAKHGYKQLILMMRSFIIWLVPRMTPRSLSDDVVGYGIVIQYRAALMFWAQRVYKLRDDNTVGPRTAELFNPLTEAIRYITRQIGMPLRRRSNLSFKKSYVGLPELLQLIEMDVRATPNIMFAEGHHFAWTIGRLCAVRPGALGPPPDSKAEQNDGLIPYLAFKDILVTRGGRPGEFNMELTIRNLKGQNKWDQIEMAGHTLPPVRFYIKSAQRVANLSVSAPHRFLVLALRRGALKHYTTLEELLGDERRTISIKEEFLDKPVILRGTARGFDVQLDKPATSDSLTEYIRLRGQKAGFAETITFYSIRRRAGTDFARAFGSDAARELMCHAPNTRTLERNYLQMRPAQDVSAVGLGEDHNIRQEEMDLDNQMWRLPEERVMEIYGPALNALVRLKLVDDEKWLTAYTQAQRRNRERVIRRCALKTLVAEAQKEHTENQTLRDVQMSKDTFLKCASAFNKRLLEVLGKEVENTEEEEGEADNAAEDSPFSHDFPENNRYDEQDVDEPDFEDQHQGSSSRFIRVAEEELVDNSMKNYGILLDDVDYKEAAYTAMDLMLSNGLNEYQTQVDRQCPLCLDDDTVTEAHNKFKIWEAKKLPRHMKTQFHSPYEAFKRRATIRMQNEGTPGLICIFCEPLVPAGHDQPYFASESLLGMHVDRSTDKNIASEVGAWKTKALAKKHQEEKVRYGWNNEDFKGDKKQKLHHVSSAENLRREQRGRKNSVFAFSNDKELAGPVPLPGFSPGIVRGSFVDLAADCTNTFGPGVEAVPVPTKEKSSGGPPIKLPDRLRGLVRITEVPRVSSLDSATPTADYMAGREGLAVTVAIPGTQGNMPGDGKRMSDYMDAHAAQRK